jgi:hypothetical protein
MGRFKVGFPRDGTSRGTSHCPFVPGQKSFPVPLSLCPRTKKFCLSRCPEKLHCSVSLETLVHKSFTSYNIFIDSTIHIMQANLSLYYVIETLILCSVPSTYMKFIYKLCHPLNQTNNNSCRS